jgi:hypothetical protein
MTQRARAVAVLAGLALAATGITTAVAISSAHQPAPPASSPPTTQPAPTTLPSPSTTLPDCTATTGRNPHAFTPHCSGPIVVTVTSVTCLGYVGDGYRLAYTISNTGRPVDGYVVAQVDDRPPIITEPSLHLAGSFTDLADYPQVSGDGLVVTLATAAGDTISSFPVETPGCPQDPKDVQQAREATTTT